VKARLLLTTIWLLAFVIALLVTESYLHTTTEDGIPFLFPEDRMDCMRPLIYLFGGYIGGILAFWFLKPFNKPKSGRVETVRFWIATTCTALFVIVLLYFVSYGYFFGTEGGSIVELMGTGTKMAGMMSFLVAPANVYYFGMKASSQ
jgi:hypothetical protein